MKTAHAHLNISEVEWEALMEVFQASFDHFECLNRNRPSFLPSSPGRRLTSWSNRELTRLSRDPSASPKYTDIIEPFRYSPKEGAWLAVCVGVRGSDHKPPTDVGRERCVGETTARPAVPGHHTQVSRPSAMNALAIIPTFNERENLPTVVQAVLSHDDFKVLVVDDDSSDGTGEIADELTSRFSPRVEVSIDLVHEVSAARILRALPTHLPRIAISFANWTPTYPTTPRTCPSSWQGSRAVTSSSARGMWRAGQSRTGR